MSIQPVPDYLPRLQSAWDGFMLAVVVRTPAPNIEQDTAAGSEDPWQATAHPYLPARDSFEDFCRRFEAARLALASLAAQRRRQGHAITVDGFGGR